MRYCQHCGTQNLDTSLVCSNCGKNPFVTFSERDTSDLDFGLKAIAFCIPLAGLILYFVHKSKSPKKAKDACHSSLYGMLFGFILQMLATIAGG